MKIYISFLVALFILAVILPISIGLNAYCFNAFDLGIYARAVAAFSLDNINPWISVRGVKIFFDHFDTILVFPALFLPSASPLVKILVMEMAAIILAAGAFLFLYQEQKISKTWLIFAIASIFFSHAVSRALHYPGHPSTWSLGVLTWSLVFLRTGRFSSGAMWLAACVLFKEEYAVYGFVAAAGMIYFTETRKTGYYLSAFSLIWMFLVFYLRPRMAENYVGYEHNFAQNLIQLDGLIDYYTDPNRLKTFFLMFALFIPLAMIRQIWTPGRLIVAAILAAMIAVRFVGLWWFPHRSAQVFLTALCLLIPLQSDLVSTQAIKKNILVSAVILLCLSCAIDLKYIRTIYTLSYKKSCPLQTERVAALNKATEQVLADPQGLAIVEGHFVPHLAKRDDVVLLNDRGLEGARYVLLEKPPLGDPWPLTSEKVGQIAKDLTKDPNFQIIQDGEYVLLAKRVTP